MASLIDVRNMLALQGRMEASQLSSALHLSRPMVEAMLCRMEAMGKVVRIQQEADVCLTGNCKACPEGKSACQQEWWSLTGN
jgi:ferrous iron transport protein C